MERLVEAFEENRTHLRGVAYRMLGSLSEAEDAVQEAWLRLSRADTGDVANLKGWLTTVVARVCLDQLRSRKAHPEESIDAPPRDDGPRPPAPQQVASTTPESEALMADSVGLALMVVLETLDPAERLAFVLHDVFAVPFDEIAPIVGRTPTAARQLASRARRRVQGSPAVPEADLSRQRTVVEAFLAALRGGDVEGLLAVLDPDMRIRIDGAPDQAREVRGGREWAKRAVAFSRGASAARVALINGAVGLIVAPNGRLTRALCFTVADGKVSAVDLITDADRLRTLELAVLPS